MENIDLDQLWIRLTLALGHEPTEEQFHKYFLVVLPLEIVRMEGL